MKDMEKLTKGAYKAGHPVISDKAEKDNQGHIPFKGQGTHGPGSPQNPSKPLSSKEDITGQSLPQKATFPKSPSTFPEDWVKPTPIVGSKEYFEKPEVKENMDKHSPKASTPNSSTP